MRQYHLEGDPSAPTLGAEYILGNYPLSMDEEDYDEFGNISYFTSPSLSNVPFVSQIFDRGTFCDLTSQPR